MDDCLAGIRTAKHAHTARRDDPRTPLFDRRMKVFDIERNRCVLRSRDPKRWGRIAFCLTYAVLDDVRLTLVNWLRVSSTVLATAESAVD